jgi:hypothetical protein
MVLGWVGSGTHLREMALRQFNGSATAVTLREISRFPEHDYLSRTASSFVVRVKQL